MFQFEKPNRAVDRVFLHCSASDVPAHDNIEQIRKWHVEDNGWRDVGYHYVVTKNGKIFDGRPVTKTPAAQGGNNIGTIAICLNGLKESKFTDEQFTCLKEMCLAINKAFSGKVTFHGHREVAAKACPVYDYRNILELDSFGRLGLSGSVALTLEDDTHEDPSTLPNVRLSSRGETVRLLQRLLLIKDDGIFGPRTQRSVKTFQKENGLTADGVVGPNSWRVLLRTDRVKHDEVN